MGGGCGCETEEPEVGRAQEQKVKRMGPIHQETERQTEGKKRTKQKRRKKKD